MEQRKLLKSLLVKNLQKKKLLSRQLKLKREVCAACVSDEVCAACVSGEVCAACVSDEVCAACVSGEVCAACVSGEIRVDKMVPIVLGNVAKKLSAKISASKPDSEDSSSEEDEEEVLDLFVST